jgi:hypothetical protein
MHAVDLPVGGFAVNESAGVGFASTGMLTRPTAYLTVLLHAHANLAPPPIRYCIRRAGFLEKCKGVPSERRHTTHAQSEPEAQ